MLFEQPSIRADSTRHASARRVLLILLRLTIGAGLLAYLARSGIVDFRALSKSFTMWRITFAAVTLLLLDSALMSIRLSWLFRPHGLNLGFITSLKLTLVGFFFATFLPGAAGGDLSKLFYITRGGGGRRIEIMMVVLLDRAIGLFSLLLLPIIFAPLFIESFSGAIILRRLLVTIGLLSLLAFAGLLACLFNDLFVNFIPTGARNRLTNKVVRQVRGVIATYRENYGVLLAALGMSLLANLLLVFVTMIGALTAASSSWNSRMFLVIPIGHIANSLPLTPGGLGVGEAAFNTLFNLVGLLGGAEALLLTRIWMALVGVIGFVFYLRGISREVFDERVRSDKPCPAVLGTIKS